MKNGVYLVVRTCDSLFLSLAFAGIWINGTLTLLRSELHTGSYTDDDPVRAKTQLEVDLTSRNSIAASVYRFCLYASNINSCYFGVKF